MSQVGSECTVERLSPQFLVRDLDAAIAFYRDMLGFDVAFVFGGFYAGVERGGASIHLKHSDEPDPSHEYKRRHEHLDAYVRVRNIDALSAELAGRGVALLSPLAATEWGTREFALADADGYILYFGEPIVPPEAAA
ncbi:MAG TPA: VOC family protein [Chthonomonadaceae bacterium]|nr:VOC family protein [Chthonomonadaceae bacterium]